MFTQDSTGIIYMTNPAGDRVFAWGATVPSDAVDGYAKGCLFIDTDVVTGTVSVYVNQGTKDSCVFKLVNVDTTVTAEIAELAVTAAKLAADAVETAKIKDLNVTLAKLAAAIAPSHVVKFAGSFTTAGGDAAETISVPGALNTDIAIVTLKAKGSTPRTILTAVAATDGITLEFSGDPAADHVVAYQILRATA